MKRRNTPVYMLIEPEASSSIDQPQRFCLALPPHQLDRHAAMADIAVDGAPEIEPVAAPPRQVAPRQPRAHGAGQPRSRLMCLLDLRGIGELAKIDIGQIVGARGAFHAAFAAAVDAGASSVDGT